MPIGKEKMKTANFRLFKTKFLLNFHFTDKKALQIYHTTTLLALFSINMKLSCRAVTKY